MTRLSTSLLAGFAALALAATASAQRYISPPASASAVIDGDHISIDYYAPSMHGRKVMGGLVPFDQVWCTGANWATKITTEADLDINGLKVPKGSYSIWTLPSDKQWMLIINKQTGQFHLDYDQSQDFARVKMNVKTLPSPVETLKIEVQSRCCTKAPGAKLVLSVARSVGGLRHVLRHHLLAIDAQHAPGDG
jgi:hypothetical protein